MTRNEILVNGKPLFQIEEELAVPFPREKTKRNRNGEPYFPVEVYEERLIEVLGGRRWFNIDCSPAQVYQVGERYVISVCVAVEILSDSNEIIWKKSASGGSNVIIINSSGEAKSLKSDIKSAMSEALKNVYQQFGIGIGQLRQMKNPSSASGYRDAASGRQESSEMPTPVSGSRHSGQGTLPRNAGSSGTGQGSGASAGNRTVQTGGGRQDNQRERTIVVKFLSRFNSMSGGYSANVVCVETGEQRKLVIFKDAVPTIEKHCTMAKFIDYYGKDRTLSFIGYDNTYHGTKQFVFKQPVMKPGAA